MEDYFTLFDGWQLIFDDPEQSLSQYSLGQVIDLPNFGEFEQFCMRVFKERSGVPVPNFHRVVYNCFRFGDSPNLHIDGEQEDALALWFIPILNGVKHGVLKVCLFVTEKSQMPSSLNLVD